MRAQRASNPLPAPESTLACPSPTPLALPREELAALIAGIVQVTLDTRLGEHEAARRADLARELQARLLALFGSPPPSAVQAQNSSAKVPRAENPPASREPVGDASLTTPPGGSATPMERVLGLVLEERLLRLGGALAVRADLRERLIGLALQRLASTSEDSTASGEELRGLDVLQRRASKLERSLQEARAALAYVSGLEHVDAGIASVYQAVQGLSLEEPQRELKRNALECLFRANLTLQKPGA